MYAVRAAVRNQSVLFIKLCHADPFHNRRAHGGTVVGSTVLRACPALCIYWGY